MRSKWGPPHTPERWNIYSTLFHHSSLISFSLSGLHLSVRTACRTACSKTSASKAASRVSFAAEGAGGDSADIPLQRNRWGGPWSSWRPETEGQELARSQAWFTSNWSMGESQAVPTQARPHFEKFVLPGLLAVICSTLLPLPATNMVTWSSPTVWYSDFMVFPGAPST